MEKHLNTNGRQGTTQTGLPKSTTSTSTKPPMDPNKCVTNGEIKVLLDDLFDRISEKIEDGNRSLRQEIMPILDTIQKEHKTLCDRVTNVEETNKKQTEQAKKSKKEVDILANDVNDLGHMQKQLKEQQDRLKRLNNIVVMGIPEDENEIETLEKVMQVVMPLNNLRLRAKEMRIGAAIEGKIRPIRVQMNCNNDVWSALSKSKDLKSYTEYENIYIRKDNTRAEREERAKYRANPYMTRAQTTATATASKRSRGNDDEGPAPKINRMDTSPSI
ncbi:unnamed protein product [Orchesella dallaii]|uniref:Uncharacterized protein n=1 Tax=Orchesella dallaii TaxID=48710 RepID=A0ABP1Q7L6_9HEXA